MASAEREKELFGALKQGVIDYDEDVTRETAQAVIDEGIDAYTAVFDGLVEPVGTGSILSGKMFAEFVEPYFIEIHNFIKSKGLPILDHICGDCLPILDSWMRTEPTVLSVDRLDIGEVSRLVGDKVGVMGNVTPGKTLFMGTPESVDAEVKEVLEKAGKNPCGFVLASGCEVPVGTPADNIFAMMNAARKL